MATIASTDLSAVTVLSGYRQATAAEVKAWAADNGFTVKPGRGRMPLEAVHAYNKAHKRSKRQYVLASKVQAEVTYAYTTASGRPGKFTAQPKDVRAWAEAEGLVVGKRGRFSAEVRNAYGQAHAKPRKARKAKADATA